MKYLTIIFLLCIVGIHAATQSDTGSWTPSWTPSWTVTGTGSWTVTQTSSWTKTQSSTWTGTGSSSLSPSTTSTMSASMTSTASFPTLAACTSLTNSCPTQPRLICIEWVCPDITATGLTYAQFEVYINDDLTTPVDIVQGLVFTSNYAVPDPGTVETFLVRGVVTFNGVDHFTDFSVATDLNSAAANEKQDSTLAAGNDLSCALNAAKAADNGGVAITCTWTNGASTRFYTRANLHIMCHPTSTNTKGANPYYARDKRFFVNAAAPTTPKTTHTFWGIPSPSQCRAYFRAYYPRESIRNFRSMRFNFPTAVDTYFTV